MEIEKYTLEDSNLEMKTEKSSAPSTSLTTPSSRCDSFQIFYYSDLACVMNTFDFNIATMWMLIQCNIYCSDYYTLAGKAKLKPTGKELQLPVMQLLTSKTSNQVIKILD